MTIKTCDLSIIIPSYFSKYTLTSCLRSIVTQSTKFTYEVIVVHTGTEPVLETVLSCFPFVQFHIIEERWLPGKARNWALRNTNSPWILFIDSDCIIDPDYIQTVLSYAKASGVDGVGGNVRNGSPKDFAGWVMHLLEFNEWLGGDSPQPCRNFPSCNALYRRSILIEVDGFPETIFPCEDTILNHKLFTAGYSLAYFPKCGVKHIHTRSWMGVIRHNYTHGLTYGYAAQTYNLLGKDLLKFEKTLAFLLAIGARLIRITHRLFTQHKQEMLIWIVSMPVVLVCLTVWAFGFVNWRALENFYESDQ